MLHQKYHEMKDMRESGKTLETIGAITGFSKERVRQILEEGDFFLERKQQLEENIEHLQITDRITIEKALAFLGLYGPSLNIRHWVRLVTALTNLVTDPQNTSIEEIIDIVTYKDNTIPRFFQNSYNGKKMYASLVNALKERDLIEVAFFNKNLYAIPKSQRPVIYHVIETRGVVKKNMLEGMYLITKKSPSTSQDTVVGMVNAAFKDEILNRLNEHNIECAAVPM